MHYTFLLEKLCNSWACLPIIHFTITCGDAWKQVWVMRCKTHLRWASLFFLHLCKRQLGGSCQIPVLKMHYTFLLEKLCNSWACLSIIHFTITCGDAWKQVWVMRCKTHLRWASLFFLHLCKRQLGGSCQIPVLKMHYTFLLEKLCNSWACLSIIIFTTACRGAWKQVWVMRCKTHLRWASLFFLHLCKRQLGGSCQRPVLKMHYTFLLEKLCNSWACLPIIIFTTACRGAWKQVWVMKCKTHLRWASLFFLHLCKRQLGGSCQIPVLKMHYTFLLEKLCNSWACLSIIHFTITCRGNFASWS